MSIPTAEETQAPRQAMKLLQTQQTIADIVGSYTGDEIYQAFQAWYSSRDDNGVIPPDMMEVLTKEAKKFSIILDCHPPAKQELVVLSIIAAGGIAGLLAAQGCGAGAPS